ncbi:MAG: hypothetical protein P8Q93_09430 [Ascidiaceihabitans sp.]|nr:hypothetical protein [Ascidiaceihabitans sp.]
MSKVTQFLTVCGVLAVAGCSASDADLSTVRGGPQVEDPAANAPDGKMTAGSEVVYDSGAVVASDNEFNRNADIYAAGFQGLLTVVNAK